MTGRWLLSAGDTGKPTHSLHPQDSGPLTEIDLGTRPALILQYRDLADLDALTGGRESARPAHGHGQARPTPRRPPLGPAMRAGGGRAARAPPGGPALV